MGELQVIIQNNERVLTTSQLAESYGAEEKLIQQNFNNNKARYTEGKHFVLLQGEELRVFKRDFENFGFAPNLNKLYLWTKKGALMHAKSLNTDAAWEAYEQLVDKYYELQEVLTAEQQLRKQLELSIMTSQRVDRIEKVVTHLENTMRVDTTEQFKIREAANKKVLSVIGGKHAPAYRQLKAQVYSQLWRDFKQYFVLPRYPDLPKAKFDEALEFISIWEPSAAVKMEIKHLNGQVA